MQNQVSTHLCKPVKVLWVWYISDITAVLAACPSGSVGSVLRPARTAPLKRTSQPKVLARLSLPNLPNQ